MWYKEWLTLRFRVGAAILFYLLIGWASITIWLGSQQRSLFDIWIPVSGILTLSLGALAGVEAVSDEKDKGTLSFLLTRPVSRAQVYAGKIISNAIPLMGVYGSISLVMLVIAHLPLPVRVWDYALQRVTYETPYHVTSLGYSFLEVVTVVLAGISMLCFTTLVSIFARNVISALISSLMIFLSVGVGLTVLDMLVLHSLGPFIGSLFLEPGEMLVFSFGLAGLAAAFYRSGQQIFQHKEF